MTVSQNTGAASHIPIDWLSIDWKKAQEAVNRLQARIVKAIKEGRWNKAKALGHLLTNSFSGKVLAIKRVTSNQGSETPGVDGEVWKTPSRKSKAIQQLRRRGYQPQPLRRVYIPKSNGKLRPLGIPTMHDRAIQALHLLALDPMVETISDPSSFGFRRERSTADAISRCHVALCRRISPKYVLEADIKSCFDKIDHDWLLKYVPMDKMILRKWLKAGYLEQGIFYDTIAGTPQGGVISPTLANFALNGLERLLKEHFPTMRLGLKVNIIRYADDFIVTGNSRELLETMVKPAIEEFLKERGLELSQEKTTITHIKDGFDFLGQHIRRYQDKKTLVTPSKKNVQTFLQKVKLFIMNNLHLDQAVLIMQLNPKIRGWANYHRHASSKQTFRKVDAKIFWMLWKWCRRRHPNKPKKWLRERYFGTLESRNWIFQTSKKKGNSLKRIRLCRASEVLIIRHVPVKGEANPYDPQWRPYFEQKRKKRASDTRNAA